MYSIHIGVKTHSEAVKTCKGLGGKLFEPKSASVNKAVLAFARTKGIPIGKGIWIGIHDKTNEGKFTYESDGKPITWKNWNKNEPNNCCKGGEDCVHLTNGLYGGGGLWNDLSCSRKLAFVCEKAEKGSRGEDIILNIMKLFKYLYLQSVPYHGWFLVNVYILIYGIKNIF